MTLQSDFDQEPKPPFRSSAVEHEQETHTSNTTLRKSPFEKSHPFSEAFASLDHQSHLDGIPLETKWNHTALYLLLLLLSLLWVTFSLMFAFLVASRNAKFVLTKPENTVLALNVLS